MFLYGSCQGVIKSSDRSHTIRREVWRGWTRVLEAPCCAEHLLFPRPDYGEALEGPDWERRQSGWHSEGSGGGGDF